MKKHFILAMLIAFTAISCNKDDSLPETPPKKILLARTSTTYTNDGSTVITEYRYDEKGRIVSELKNKGTAKEHLITYSYDNKDNIAVQKFPNSGNLRTEYTYDNQNRMTSSQKYATDGSKDGKSTYTYYEDRIEEVLTSKAGFNTKRQFRYTANKEDIANFKIYYGDGKLLLDQTYTHSTIKNPLRIVNPLTPYNGSTHLIEKTVVVDYYDGPANPDNYNYNFKIVANANGYPASVTETLEGVLQATTTYEYSTK